MAGSAGRSSEISMLGYVVRVHHDGKACLFRSNFRHVGVMKISITT